MTKEYTLSSKKNHGLYTTKCGIDYCNSTSFCKTKYRLHQKLCDICKEVKFSDLELTELNFKTRTTAMKSKEERFNTVAKFMDLNSALK